MESATRAEREEETATLHVVVRPTTWKRLNARKSQGVSFDDVITELLDDADETLAEDTRRKASA